MFPPNLNLAAESPLPWLLRTPITEAEPAAKVVLTCNVNENPMDRLFSQPLIAAEQRDAGLRPIGDWELSQIGAMRGAEPEAWSP